MVEVKGFVKRVENNHIYFKKGGVFLFNFPMTFIQLNEYISFVNDLVSILGFEKTRQIFYSVGFIQGNFAIDYFKKKFNISPEEKDLSFTTEQYKFLGFGNVNLEDISFKNKKVILRDESFSPYPGELYDFYLEGVSAGTFSGLFNEKMSAKCNKENNSLFICNIFKSDSIPNLEFYKNYFLKTITVKTLPIEKNLIYEFNSIIKKKEVYYDEEGLFFNSKKYIMNLMSVFVGIYYLCIEENMETRKNFMELGKKCAQNFLENLNFKNKLDILDLLGFSGFGTVKIISLKKIKAILLLEFSSFEFMSKNLFKEKYSYEYNDFKIGFLFKILSFLGYEFSEYRIHEKNNAIILNFSN